MSSISGVTSSPSWLQMLQAQAASSSASSASTASTATTTAASASSATSGTSATDATSTTGRPHRHGGHGGGKMEKALEDQGITGTKLSDLRTQIDSAMKTAKSDGTDPKSAIEGVLSAAGVDMTAFAKEMAPPSGAARPDGSPPDADADDSTSATAAASGTSTSSLDSLLSGTGIDATSFKSSLMSMLNSSDPNSAGDSSSLFSNAAIGSSLDIAA